MKSAVSLGVLAVAFLVAGSAHAAKVHFAGTFDPDEEVTQPVVLDGHNPNGGAVFTYDDATKTLCGRIEFDDLTGPPSGVHVHQAPKGMPKADGSATDKVIIPITASPMTFKVILNASWETSLMTGEIYTNVHTTKNPKGELRATMDPFPEGNEIVCPPGAPLQIGVPADAGAPASDAGATSSSSGSSGPATPPPENGSTSGTPPSDKPLQAAEPAPKADTGGCSSSASAPANVLSLGIVAGLALIAARARLRRKNVR